MMLNFLRRNAAQDRQKEHRRALGHVLGSLFVQLLEEVNSGRLHTDRHLSHTQMAEQMNTMDAVLLRQDLPASEYRQAVRNLACETVRLMVMHELLGVAPKQPEPAAPVTVPAPLPHPLMRRYQRPQVRASVFPLRLRGLAAAALLVSALAVLSGCGGGADDCEEDGRKTVPPAECVGGGCL
jgi:hypothetical protein